MDKLLKRVEVEAVTGISTATLYELMRAGRFPEPLRVGPRAVRWRESEIEAWMESRPRASGEAAGCFAA